VAATTGPVLAIGAITMLNQSVLHDRPVDWKVPIATGVACGFFAVLEKGEPRVATLMAWGALVTILLSRVNGVPSPVESFLSWWNTNQGTAGAGTAGGARPV
jgi:hypothetical protein